MSFVELPIWLNHDNTDGRGGNLDPGRGRGGNLDPGLLYRRDIFRFMNVDALRVKDLLLRRCFVHGGYFLPSAVSARGGSEYRNDNRYHIPVFLLDVLFTRADHPSVLLKIVATYYNFVFESLGDLGYLLKSVIDAGYEGYYPAYLNASVVRILYMGYFARYMQFRPDFGLE